MNQPAVLVSDPALFQAAIARWMTAPMLWIDTEVAFWWTKTPRLSLLQVLEPDGTNTVVDVLDATMAQVVEDNFIPSVMANAAIVKWAHYARFERRYLGGAAVANLQCTFQLAKTVPYFKLPLLSLTLARLVHHFFETHLDKTAQKADWAVRPLSPDLVAYAASDTIWCRRVQEKLTELAESLRADDDDLDSLVDAFDLLLPRASALAHERSAVRDVALAHMKESGVSRWSRFSMQHRHMYSVSLPPFCAALREEDPSSLLEVTVRLPKALEEQVGPDLATVLVRHENARPFRTPRAPRVRDEPTYAIPPVLDVEAFTTTYEALEHRHLLASSERAYVRQCIRRILEQRQVDSYKEFRFGDPRRVTTLDVSEVVRRELPSVPPIAVSFPRRLQDIFSEERLEKLKLHAESREAVALRWLPHARQVGLELQQERDVDGLDGGEDDVPF